MKKLLSLLGAFTISGSGVASVTAFGSESETKSSKLPPLTTNQIVSDANKIVSEITVKDISVAYQNDKSVGASTLNMRKALLAANAKNGLTQKDVDSITFKVNTLVPNQKVEVTAIVTDSVGDVATINIGVTMDEETAQQIADKVKDKNVNILWNKNLTISANAGSIRTVLTALNAINGLTKEDVAHITFSKGTLTPGKALEPITGTVIFTDGEGKIISKAIISNIIITMAIQPTKQIASKITFRGWAGNPILIDNSSDKKVADNFNNIRSGLRDRNRSLTIDETNWITFSGANLSETVSRTVVATIQNPNNADDRTVIKIVVKMV